jgi:hypothetical protein
MLAANRWSRALAAALALLVGLAGCTPQPGAVTLDDQTGVLDPDAVAAAAAPLVSRGAQVAVFVVEQGDDTGEDLSRRLAEAGLLQGGQIAPGALAVYASYAPRYSELRAGAGWSRDLPAETLRAIRTAHLNPALQGDRLAAGVAATLQALEERIANPPLARRLLGWLGYAVLAAFAVAAVAISPLGEWLARRWRRSPPGRLARWLADQTPAGRRRLQSITRSTRQRLDDRVEYARGWCNAAASGPRRDEGAPLKDRLAQLDKERTALLKAGTEGRRLVEAMDRLAWAYERLGHEAARLAPPAPIKNNRRRAAAASSAAAAASSAFDSAPPATTPSDTSTSWDSPSPGESSPSSDGGPW